jgi:hypothetical protein
MATLTASKGVLFNLYSNAASFRLLFIWCSHLETLQPKFLSPLVLCTLSFRPELSYSECFAALDRHDAQPPLDDDEGPWWLTHPGGCCSPRRAPPHAHKRSHESTAGPSRQG